MSDGAVHLERRDGVGVVTLDRPEKLNALAGTMRDDLRRLISEAAADEEVLGLVVTGAGRAFCAGGDVRRMAELRDSGDEAGFRALLHAGVEVVLALQAFPGITVAAVNGVAAGAGLGLALACDLRLAAPTARFAATWGRVGLAPDWGASFWLPRTVGLGLAAEMVLTGEPLGVETALRHGLIQRIVDEGELIDRAVELVRRHGRARTAVASSKQLLRRGLEDSLEHAMAREMEAQEECFESDDFGEGLEAFVEGRDPEFEGR